MTWRLWVLLVLLGTVGMTGFFLKEPAERPPDAKRTILYVSEPKWGIYYDKLGCNKNGLTLIVRPNGVQSCSDAIPAGYYAPQNAEELDQEQLFVPGEGITMTLADDRKARPEDITIEINWPLIEKCVELNFKCDCQITTTTDSGGVWQHPYLSQFTDWDAVRQCVKEGGK